MFLTNPNKYCIANRLKSDIIKEIIYQILQIIALVFVKEGLP